MADTTRQLPKQADIYDEEFFNNLQLAKALMDKIPRETEKNICRKWIMKLLGLKSDEPAVKRNRNHFFRYLLSVMNKGTWGVAAMPQHYGYPQVEVEIGAEVPKVEQQFLCRWSGDRKTYVATKPIPGMGALVYMAVAKEPKLGWDNPQDRTV